MTSSDESERALEPLPTVEHGYVQLPYDEEQFRDFLRSLLGSSQSLSSFIEGPFVVDREQIASLYHLLQQRISQQNAGTLAHFSAAISQSDGTTVELQSVDELYTYNEVRDVTTTAVQLIWDFVIQFPEKSSPEKQRIVISIATQQFDIIDQPLFPPQYVRISPRSGIAVRIEHTERTWGSDILGLLTSHIKSLSLPGSRWRKFLRDKTWMIIIPFLILFMGGSIVSIFVASNRFGDSLQIPFDSPDSEKLSHITEIVSSGNWAEFYIAVVVFLLFAWIVAAVFAILIDIAAVKYDRSAVVLTRNDQRAWEKIQGKDRVQWLRFASVVVLNIVVGVSANALFAWWSA